MYSLKKKETKKKQKSCLKSKTKKVITWKKSGHVEERGPLSWEEDAPADGRTLLALFLSSISSFLVSSSISGGPGKL